jgi:pimeloyl-ACP methyl ester carboxylesterase
MNIRKDIKVDGKHGRPILLDTYNIEDGSKKPLIIFVHGFKGFKDWGHWHLVAEEFAQNGFYFIKFNFSHNGTTPEAPLDFGDLEAFGQNNYTKEEADIDTLFEWLEQDDEHGYDLDNVTLIGHSRGGGLSIVKTARDARIHRLITLASVAHLGFATRYPEVLENWEKEGVYYIMNGRTKQNMPLYYQLHEDILENGEKFDVEAAAKSMQKPWLIIHGTDDPAVKLTAAYQMKELCPTARVEIIEDANHVFGGKHPYSSNELPHHSRQMVALCLDFL